MKNQSEKSPLFGEVYMVEFTGTCSEQLGKRPAVVFQNNVGNVYSPNVIVLPMTSSIKKMYMPTHVLLSAEEVGLRMDSMVLCENPVTVSKSKVGSYLTTVPDDLMREIAIGHILATASASFLGFEDFQIAHERSVKLNSAETRGVGSCIMKGTSKAS